LDSRKGSPATNGRAGDRAGELLDRVGLLGFADEDRARRLGRPDLPLHVLRIERLAELDVVLRDQELDGVDRGSGHGLGGGGSSPPRPASSAAAPPAATATTRR
jgi:hypothetical protein